MEFKIEPVGTLNIWKEHYSLQLYEEFIPGLKHISGFSHLQILWWAHLTDKPQDRKKLLTRNLFRQAPDEVGVFASRTPERPNPIMLSTVRVLKIDFKMGIITFPFIDAEDGTPVIDIKPYFPMERIKSCKTPPYYSHWPNWNEDSEKFDWKREIRLDPIG